MVGRNGRRENGGGGMSPLLWEPSRHRQPTPRHDSIDSHHKTRHRGSAASGTKEGPVLRSGANVVGRVFFFVHDGVEEFYHVSVNSL